MPRPLESTICWNSRVDPSRSTMVSKRPAARMHQTLPTRFHAHAPSQRAALPWTDFGHSATLSHPQSRLEEGSRRAAGNKLRQGRCVVERSTNLRWWLLSGCVLASLMTPGCAWWKKGNAKSDDAAAERMSNNEMAPYSQSRSLTEHSSRSGGWSSEARAIERNLGVH